MRQAYFDAAATRIQKHWRGIYSRRVKHNFYKRKEFLQQASAAQALTNPAGVSLLAARSEQRFAISGAERNSDASLRAGSGSPGTADAFAGGGK